MWQSVASTTAIRRGMSLSATPSSCGQTRIAPVLAAAVAALRNVRYLSASQRVSAATVGGHRRASAVIPSRLTTRAPQHAPAFGWAIVYDGPGQRSHLTWRERMKAKGSLFDLRR